MKQFRLFFISSIILTASIAIIAWQKKAAPVYSIDISKDDFKLVSDFLKLGTHVNAKGESLDANSLYFIRNGKPWFPVMGEFHFTRFPRDQWESSILKMKAAGIDVIATYVFWIYHEEEEGKWDWSGNRDLRYFAGLCAKHQVNLFIRIGPWCHGEVRNGGFPDWVLNKTKTRSNDSAYLHYVSQFFAQIDQQLKGFYFKEGGTIIGAQMENEYRFNNPKGLAHILTIKKIAIDAGIDVPYYTATGWPGADIKQNELLPVYGGYPEAPWDKKVTKLPLSDNYLFHTLRIDRNIGNDLLGNQSKDTTAFTGYRYPYATAEMGAGIQVTYHRRPIIEPDDVTAMAYTVTGSGANLLGYYMFHGGSNSIGKLSTLQESKATKYPNDYPIINYDFQSPIGEWGELQPSYKAFKLLHLFLNDFGEQLAPCHAFFPDQKPSGVADNETLRWTVRANKGSGFIFINNFERQLKMHDLEDVQLAIKSKDGSLLHIPDQPVSIKQNAQIIWPFNMNLAGMNLVYATAQPICHLNNSGEEVYVFFAPEGIKPEFLFDKTSIQKIATSQSSIETKGATYKVNINEPGKNSFIQLKLVNGKNIRIIVLSHQQALNSWKATVSGKEHLFITAADLLIDKDSVHLQSRGKGLVELSVFPSLNGLAFKMAKTSSTSANGLFTDYHINFSEKKWTIDWKEDDAVAAKLPSKNIDTSKAISYPLYGPSLNAVPNAKYWQVSIPKNALTGLSNAYLQIEYEGDTQAAYLNDQLIADDFYKGLPMVIGLYQFGKTICGNKISLMVTALTDDSKIYFEEGIRDALRGKRVARIKEITLVPQYETMITGF